MDVCRVNSGNSTNTLIYSTSDLQACSEAIYMPDTQSSTACTSEQMEEQLYVSHHVDT